MPSYICDECGDDVKTAEATNETEVRIIPCDNCMKESHSEGYDEACGA